MHHIQSHAVRGDRLSRYQWPALCGQPSKSFTVNMEIRGKEKWLSYTTKSERLAIKCKFVFTALSFPRIWYAYISFRSILILWIDWRSHDSGKNSIGPLRVDLIYEPGVSLREECDENREMECNYTHTLLSWNWNLWILTYWIRMKVKLRGMQLGTKVN